MNIKEESEIKTIALCGNPNVGKSTIFNALTGLNQHTGNWTGKTIDTASGKYTYKGRKFTLVDIPGTYSLMANSSEEEIARNFICFENPDAVIVVLDATCFERNLNLVLQVMEITGRTVLCLNLCDEAEKKGIQINTEKLSSILKVPVVKTTATEKDGIKNLTEAAARCIDENNSCSYKITYPDYIETSVSHIKEKLLENFSKNLSDKINLRWLALKLLENDTSLIASMKEHLNLDIYENQELTELINNERENVKNYIDDKSLDIEDEIVFSLIQESENISRQVLSFTVEKSQNRDRKIDNIITSKKFGIPLMILMLIIILWITIVGANYPSELLSDFLFSIQDKLSEFFITAKAPSWLEGLLVQGMFKTLAWVVSVMLPPMAIFFPLFTLLEDLGYLPRIAFNLDNYFKKACSCGKQALTMCMGFGCNCAGITGCRIIDSPRERLIAIITNNFVPCNGRFPIIITISAVFFTGFFSGPLKSLVSALMLTGFIVLGIVMTLIISKILSKTILKGIPSSFTLELPPYRKPQIKTVIVRSILDRTIFVLWRAVKVAAPAGLVIWIMANVHINDMSILTHCALFLDPFAKLMGLDGYILMAFILGFPANEIVLPIIIMSYMASGTMMDMSNTADLASLLISNGWTWVTGVCMILFSLMHWPCSTACLTIKKETGSWKWTAVSMIVPAICGIIICMLFNFTAVSLGLA